VEQVEEAGRAAYHGPTLPGHFTHVG